ncbi:thyrostimulin beta-5 subunit [Ischnura elegans]|uniref:thyrostimulin beta-5 subunit n=1 Tax=Ischnura elegans TaxID=197161 RepID=UPI001ED879E2|nr:thyrostimulin beta-5 subunit [Ischnura elegans]
MALRRCSLLSRALPALPTPPLAALLLLLFASSSGWSTRGGGGGGGFGDLLMASAAAESVSVPSSMSMEKAVNLATTLQCHQRRYKYRVSKSDSMGRKCWDDISVMSCWGRCDSNEISDWRFPYKKSYHPVCMYGTTKVHEVELRFCDEGVEPGTERYASFEAKSCVCSVCSSSTASCEGLRYRGQRSSLLYLQGGRV